PISRFACFSPSLPGWDYGFTRWMSRPHSLTAPSLKPSTYTKARRISIRDTDIETSKGFVWIETSATSLEYHDRQELQGIRLPVMSLRLLYLRQGYINSCALRG